MHMSISLGVITFQPSAQIVYSHPLTVKRNITAAVHCVSVCM